MRILITAIVATILFIAITAAAMVHDARESQPNPLPSKPRLFHTYTNPDGVEVTEVIDYPGVCGSSLFSSQSHANKEPLLPIAFLTCACLAYVIIDVTRPNPLT